MKIDELIARIEKNAEAYDSELLYKAAETIRLLWEIAQDTSNSKYKMQIDEMRGEDGNTA